MNYMTMNQFDKWLTLMYMPYQEAAVRDIVFSIEHEIFPHRPYGPNRYVDNRIFWFQHLPCTMLPQRAESLEAVRAETRQYLKETAPVWRHEDELSLYLRDIAIDEGWTLEEVCYQCI